MAEATDLDVDGRKLALDTGQELPYDSLILACGAETSYSVTRNGGRCRSA